MKILNLYSGIGGNRKLWGDEHQVTAVEFNPEIAKIYEDFFPNDNVIIGDAHEYLLKKFKEFDFIWSSPPCQSHSDIRRMGAVAGMYEPIYPDMKLYQEIILLKTFCNCNWVVENVKPHYKPLIEPQYNGRHCFWSNFFIKEIKMNDTLIIRKVKITNDRFGLNISKYKCKTRKDQILRNMVNPELGLHIFDSAFNKTKQKNVGDFNKTLDFQNNNSSSLRSSSPKGENLIKSKFNKVFTMEYKPKKRYLEFIDISNSKNKTKLFDVWNKVTNQKLGQIKWDTGWRCYVFDDGELKMAEGCEFEMFEKLKELREERENLTLTPSLHSENLLTVKKGTLGVPLHSKYP